MAQNIISILIQAKDGVTSVVNDVGQSFQSNMKKVSLATGVAGVALTAFAKSSVNDLKSVYTSSKTLAQQTGMTIEQASSLSAAMNRVGLSTESTSAAFTRFSKVIANSRSDASDNAAKLADMNNKIQGAQIQITKYNEEIKKSGDASGELHNKIDALNIQIKGYQKNISDATGALDKLGVSTVTSTGSNKDFNSILLEVADKFKAMPDGAEKTAAALELFGRSGAQMIKILNKGSEGIQELEQQAEKLGLTLTTKNITAVQKYIQSQKDLNDSMQATKIQVGTLTAPVLARFNEMLNKTVQTLVAGHGPLQTFTADVLAFGGPVLSGVSAVTAFAANVATAIPLFIGFTGAVQTGAAAMQLSLAGLTGRAGILGVSTAFQGLAAQVAIQSGEMAGVAGIGAVTSSVGGLQRALASPMGISIATAGAIADIYLVFQAVMSVKQAISDLNAAAASKKQAIQAMQDRIASDKNLLKNGTPEQQTRALADLQKVGQLSQVMNVPQFASGGYTGSGGANEVAGIVHKGEYVLPQSMVDQGSGMPKAMGAGAYIGQINVYNDLDVNRVVRQIGWGLATR